MHHSYKDITCLVAIENELNIHRHRCNAAVTPNLRQFLDFSKRHSSIAALYMKNSKKRNHCRIVTESQCRHLTWNLTGKNLVCARDDILEEELSVLVTDLAIVH